MWTSQNTINFDLDGVGIALSYNGVNDNVLFKTQWPKIQAAIQTAQWSARVNHFPDFGMPVFR